MSQIFYESDNLTITGWGGRIISTDIIWTIRLIFSIHVNGKLKTFFHQFPLERNQVFSLDSNKSEYYYVLKDWYAWNAVHETLVSLGYMLDTRPSIMNTWTWKIADDCDMYGVNTPIPEPVPLDI